MSAGELGWSLVKEGHFAVTVEGREVRLIKRARRHWVVAVDGRERRIESRCPTFSDANAAALELLREAASPGRCDCGFDAIQHGRGPHGQPICPRRPAQRRPRVLIVEDDPQVYKALGRSLKARGCEVHISDDAGSALRHFELNRDWADAVICDVDLGGVSGRIVLERWRAIGGVDAAFAFHTGEPERVADAGIRVFVKPADPATIVEFVEATSRG